MVITSVRLFLYDLYYTLSHMVTPHVHLGIQLHHQFSADSLSRKVDILWAV